MEIDACKHWLFSESIQWPVALLSDAGAIELRWTTGLSQKVVRAVPVSQPSAPPGERSGSDGPISNERISLSNGNPVPHGGQHLRRP